MKQLIVSADDFGLARGINEGIAKAFREGIVTSINVIPAGGAYYDALAFLKELKPPEIGAHLALTEVTPVTGPGKIPTLVDIEGRFCRSRRKFFLRLISKKISREDIYTELRNQMERLKEIGLPITSLSGHEHIHMFPEILKIFIEIAKEYRVPAVRFLHGDSITGYITFKKFYRKAVLVFFGKSMGLAIRKAGIRCTDNFLGFLDSGNLEEETLIGMLKALRDGTTELVAHPGLLSPEVLDKCVFHRRCETDLAALVSRRVKKVIDGNGIRLIKFSDLAGGQ
jgi:chitin disaccharide deacetylase